ncbi:MAG: amidohydrolase family protein [Flavobacteriales bacterium]
MPKGSLINIHIHVFTDKCVPGNFLRMLPKKFVRRFPQTVLAVLRAKGVRKAIRFINGPGGRFLGNLKKKETLKLLSFLDIGLLETQHDVFNKELEVANAFDAQARIVILTMNMDYMDTVPPERMDFKTQLANIDDLKRHMPDRAFPFLGIDPRHLKGQEGLTWAKDKILRFTKKDNIVYPYYSGLKLYPALGFFPFDGRLYEIFEYAARYEIPVMTHTTRVGSQYIGPHIEDLIPSDISSIVSNRTVLNETIKTNLIEIQQRILQYRGKSNWIKNDSRGNNDFACDLFSHPQNYVILLEQFPNLKLCLAHMGGNTEIDPELALNDSELIEIRKIDRQLWFQRIKEMMIQYPSLYTDISYTVSELGKKEILLPILELMETLDSQGRPLGDRVLFGTDFFMTEREDTELTLFQNAKNYLSRYWERITVTNNERFLGIWAGQEIKPRSDGPEV